MCITPNEVGGAGQVMAATRRVELNAVLVWFAEPCQRVDRFCAILFGVTDTRQREKIVFRTQLAELNVHNPTKLGEREQMMMPTRRVELNVILVGSLNCTASEDRTREWLIKDRISESTRRVECA